MSPNQNKLVNLTLPTTVTPDTTRLVLEFCAGFNVSVSCLSRCNRECRLRAGDIALPTTQSRKSTICTGDSSSRAAAALYAPQSSVTIYATLRYLVRNNNNPNVVGVLMRTACSFSFCRHVGNDTSSSVRRSHPIVPPSPRPRGGRAQGREKTRFERRPRQAGMHNMVREKQYTKISTHGEMEGDRNTPCPRFLRNPVLHVLMSGAAHHFASARVQPTLKKVAPRWRIRRGAYTET